MATLCHPSPYTTCLGVGSNVRRLARASANKHVFLGCVYVGAVVMLEVLAILVALGQLSAQPRAETLLLGYDVKIWDSSRRTPYSAIAANLTQI